MSESLRVLGQVAPMQNTNTNLYTVPSGRSAVISSIIVCNRELNTGTFHIMIRPSGAAIAPQHYTHFHAALNGESTYTLVSGITLAATDVITVWASTNNFSFHLFGSEVTV